MGGRGAKIGKKLGIQDKLKAARGKNHVKVDRSDGFNRSKELSNFESTSYKKAHTPRGAKSFLTMISLNTQITNGILARNEEYAIAKWANQKGYKNLDKKSKSDISKILKEYSNAQNIRLSHAVNSPDWYWYKHK